MQEGVASYGLYHIYIIYNIYDIKLLYLRFAYFHPIFCAMCQLLHLNRQADR